MTNDTQSERELLLAILQKLSDSDFYSEGAMMMDDAINAILSVTAARTQTPPVSAVLGKHEAFFDAVWDEYCQQDFGLESDFILDIALRLGLVREEKYNEAVHGQNHSDRWELEEGQSIYLKNALSTPPKGDSNVS